MDVSAPEIRLDPEGDGVGFEALDWMLDAARPVPPECITNPLRFRHPL